MAFSLRHRVLRHLRSEGYVVKAHRPDLASQGGAAQSVALGAGCVALRSPSRPAKGAIPKQDTTATRTSHSSIRNDGRLSNESRAHAQPLTLKHRLTASFAALHAPTHLASGFSS